MTAYILTIIIFIEEHVFPRIVEHFPLQFFFYSLPLLSLINLFPGQQPLFFT